MYIREITISGIRSLTDVRLRFKKGSNVIVGDNGAGKSNVLFAIQLVTCVDQFTLMRSERQALLHHVNANQRRNMGFVEIVIESISYQIAHKERFIRIRHTISEANDWYSINGKTVPKSAVKSMWKLAGLSARNSFYILNQGKIASLMDGGCEKQLALLNDIIGLSEHEHELRQCYKLLEDWFQKMQDAVMALFVEMTNECKVLKLQTDVFGRFEKAKSNMNALKLVMYSRNVAYEEAAYLNLKKDYRRQEIDILQIEADLNSCIAESKVPEEDLRKKLEEMDFILGVIESLKKDMVGKYNNRDRICTEKRSILMAQIDTPTNRLAEIETELNNTNCSIAVAEKVLQKLSDKSKTIKMLMEPAELELVKKNAQRIALYSKRERLVHYQSREERDQFIRGEIQRCNSNNLEYSKSKMEETESIKQCDADIVRMKSTFDAQVKKTEENEQLLKNVENEHKTKVVEIRICNARKETIHDWLMTVRERMNKLEGDLFKGELRAYRGIMGIIKEWTDDSTLGEQYHGLLLEKIQCDQIYNTVIDVVANKRLLFHIVETDTFATQLTKRFNKKRLCGTINLIALNRIPRKRFDHRFIDPSIATPLLQYLQYDQKYDAVMNLIFGNVLVCANDKCMASIAKTNRANCVLLDGTYCSSKGVLSGGYFSPRKSKMNLQSERKDLQITMADHETQLNNKMNEFIELTGRCDHLLSEMLGLHNSIKREKLKRNVGRHEDACKELIGKKNRCVCKLHTVDSLIAENNERIIILERELNSDFLVDLPQDELEFLHDLCRSIKKLEDDITLWTSELINLQSRITHTKEMLNDNKEKKESLMQEERNINAQIHVAEMEIDPEISVEERTEMDKFEAKLTNEHSRLEKVNNEIAKLKEMLEAMEAKCVEMQKRKDEQLSLHIDTDSKMKTCKTHIAYFKLKLASVKKVVNVAYCDHYKDNTAQELLDASRALRSEIRNMSPNVNRRAPEMYDILQMQLDKYTHIWDEILSCKMIVNEYLNECKIGANAVTSLIYDQIKAGFQERFRRLVPGGHGIITIRKHVSFQQCIDNGGKMSYSQQNLQKNNAEVTGFEMSVSFGGQQPTRTMNQLSGSQKTLVTLAFLFSIHAIVHTPVYMFDEVDANLDTSCAKVVATEIRQLAKKAQFIMATLKPNFVQVADRCFGVISRNGASHIRQITNQQAFAYFTMPSPPRMQLQFDEDE